MGETREFAKIALGILALAVLAIAGCDSGDCDGFTPKQITLKEADSNLKELVDQRLLFVDAAGIECLTLSVKHAAELC